MQAFLHLQSYTSKAYKSLLKELSLEFQNLALWYFISFIFGCGYFYSNPNFFSIPLITSIVLSLFSLLLISYKNLFFKFLLIITIFFNLGIANSMLHTAFIPTIKLNHELTGFIEGRIETINNTNKGAIVILDNIKLSETEPININPPKIHSKIKLTIKKRYNNNLGQGDIIRIKAKIMPLLEQIAPGGYDFNFHAQIQGISATGLALSQAEILHRKHNYLASLREKIYHSLITHTKPTHTSFMMAILLGNSDGLDHKIKDNMRLAGISHVLCISGLHLALATLICYKSLRFILNASNYIAYNFNIKIIAGIASIAFSYFYLILSGCQLAASRAFIMCATASIGVLLQRGYSPIRSLGIASFLILLINPGYSLQPSFQLSFLAVLSLIYGYNFYLNLNLSSSQPNILSRLGNYILANIYTSLLVGITTAPIVAYHFHSISNYSLIANLIAVPIISLIVMPCAFLFIFLIFLNAESFLLQILGYFIDIITSTASIVASLPYSITLTGYIDHNGFITYIIGLLILLLCTSKIRYMGLLVIFLAIMIILGTKRPDLTLDINKIAIGFRNDSNQLEIYSNSDFSYFAKSYLASWFGYQSFIQVHRSNYNIQFKTKYGKIIDVIFKDLDCSSNADVVLNYSDGSCNNPKFFDLKNFNNKRFLLIFCDKINCRINFYN